MSSAGAVASGVRQHLWRSPSHPLLCSSPLGHRSREGLRPLTLLSTLSFPPSTSHRPPFTPAQSRFSLLPLGSRGLFSAPVAASSPATRDTVSRSLDEENDEEGESQGEEDEYDVASYDDEEDGEEEEEEEEEGEDEMDDETGEGFEIRVKMEDLSDGETPSLQGQEFPTYPSPVLSVKEKKELASYAHSLGKKLKSQQVGKSGVTPSVVAAFLETLEANELLKLKVHGNCPGELPDVIRLLEASTGSVAVGQIGRSVILYRPSISKMQQAREQQAVRKPQRSRSFGGSSRPNGPKDQMGSPFLRRSGRRPAKA